MALMIGVLGWLLILTVVVLYVVVRTEKIDEPPEAPKKRVIITGKETFAVDEGGKRRCVVNSDEKLYNIEHES